MLTIEKGGYPREVGSRGSEGVFGWAWWGQKRSSPSEFSGYACGL